MNFISRKDAIAKGLKRYFNGNPCKHGHTDERYVITSQCVACVKIRNKKDREQNPEKWKEYNKEYYKTNRERVTKVNQEWRDKNIERVQLNLSRWRKNNLEKTRMYTANRKAAKKNATPAWVTEDDKFILREVYASARNKELSTGVEHHVDHVVPLQHEKVCGLHVWWNLQVLPASENLSKSNSFKEA